jgi:hypothetical protein
MKHTKEFLKDATETFYRVYESSSYGDTIHVLQSNGKTVVENLKKETKQFDKMYEALKDEKLFLAEILMTCENEKVCNDISLRMSRINSLLKEIES